MYIRKPREKTSLDEAIDLALAELRRYDPSDENYTKMLTNVETLIKLRQNDKPQQVSKDTLALVLGNLAGIVIIVGYEQRHVITSKALAFILKAK